MVELNQSTLTLQKYERWPNCFNDFKEQDWFYALQNSTVSIFIIIIIIIIITSDTGKSKLSLFYTI